MNDYWGNHKWSHFSAKTPKNLEGLRVVMFVGSLSISGGTNLILNYAYALQEAGASVTLAHLHGHREDSYWHPRSRELDVVYIAELEGRKFDLGIATWWRTVLPLLEVDCSRYIYFVQSMESRFALNYDDHNQEAEAALTYTFGLQVVTIASWLSNALIASTERPVFTVLNGIDKEIFVPSNGVTSTSPSGLLRVLVEGPLHVPMKAVDETLEVCRSIPGVEIWHVSPEKSGGSQHADRVFENVPITQMQSIYSQVDVLVKLSRVEGMFGPPLEAFHSGATAIVTRVTGSDEYIKHGVNAMEVDVDDFQSVREYLQLLVEDRDFLQKLKLGAIDTAKNWPSLQYTAREFVSACHTTMCSATLGVVDIKAAKEAHKTLIARIESGEDPFQGLPTLLVRS